MGFNKILLTTSYGYKTKRVEPNNRTSRGRFLMDLRRALRPTATSSTLHNLAIKLSLSALCFMCDLLFARSDYTCGI